MNLVAFSIRTKGLSNFSRRLWTVFTRFGVTPGPTRRALFSIVDGLRRYDAAPTFFIPATVLRRNPGVIAEVAGSGAEIGVHGYVHNDYRSLTRTAQLEQTRRAISVFDDVKMPHHGFRNPYLGWTEDSVGVFAELGFAYDSNEAVLHDVIDTAALAPAIRDGYEKSLALFQAIPCSRYTLRPHIEGALVRVPTSIPDDEMLFDRLRLTDAGQVGAIWSVVLRRVYILGGIYTLNLHPERGILCRAALDALLATASAQPLPVWIARIGDVAGWWRERRATTLTVTPDGAGRWCVAVNGSPRASVLARGVAVVGTPAEEWGDDLLRIAARDFTVEAERAPVVAVTARTPDEVRDFLAEQGYPVVTVVTASDDDDHNSACVVDLPGGLGATRAEQIARRAALVDQVEGSAAPLVRLALWPNRYHAALAVSGDIDSITVQDFFLRILEVR